MALILASAHPPNSPARLHALIPAAGIGSRAGTAGPKQYELLDGRPLVLHTLSAFTRVRRLASVLVVVAPGDQRLAAGEGYDVVPCGGATRAASVAAGLDELARRGASGHDWVLVHDAARCLVQPEWIEALIAACEHDAVGGLLAQPLTDTLKAEEGGRVQATLPRGGKWLAQTPQMFRLDTLRQALAQAGDAVTDEASAIEAMGLRPMLVAASGQNIKVTWPEDFALAQAVLRSRQP
ncbi:MAG: 2-C-methyl-D-erythritol 4-phosphate cytidylyltransferase [Ramlibacter sp.]